jgi:hypothetical protein
MDSINNMAIFYILHETFNSLKVDVKEDGTIDHGRRNSKLFLLGVFTYVFLYLLLINIRLKNKNPIYDSMLYGLLYMGIADCIVMVYIYRNYFGRSFINEVSELATNESDNYNYNENTHTYKKKRKAFIVTKLPSDLRNLGNDLNNNRIVQNRELPRDLGNDLNNNRIVQNREDAIEDTLGNHRTNPRGNLLSEPDLKTESESEIKTESV